MKYAPYHNLAHLPDWLRYFDESITFLDQQRNALMARFDDLNAAVARLEQVSADNAAAIAAINDELVAMKTEDTQIADLTARVQAASDKLAAAKPAS